MSLPVITHAYPTTGLLYGFTSVDISGSHFTGTTNVFFKDTNNTNYDVSFTILNDTAINLYSPSSTIPQTMQIYVTNAQGTSTTHTSFTFDNQSPLYGRHYAMGASGGFYIEEGFPKITLLPSLNQYDTTNALQVTYDVRKFNQLLGLIKDPSNISIIETSFNSITNAFPNDKITLNAADFVEYMSLNQVISVGTYSTLYSDFDEYVNAYFSYGNFTPLISSPPASAGHYDLYHGVFDATSFMHIITGTTRDSTTEAYVSDVSGSISIENVNTSLLYLVHYNTYKNRNGQDENFFYPSNETNYRVADGFIDGDLIYVPDGTNIKLTLKIEREPSNYITYAAGGTFNPNNSNFDNQCNYNSKYGENTYTSDMNTNDISGGVYYITQNLTAPLLIRLANLSTEPYTFGHASIDGM